MSAETSSPFRVLERLIEDVLRLRRVMAQNDFDARLQQRDYSFNYLVDTPVFRLFAEPSRYAGMVAAVPSLTMLDHDLDDQDQVESAQPRHENYQDALFANALLTGEYIFKLAATPDKRPVLISPEHANEIFAYISHLENRSRGLFRHAKLDPGEVFRELRYLLEIRIQEGNPSAARWLSSHRQPIIRQISQAAHSPLLAPSRIANLFQREAIANAAQALDFDDATISPSFELVSYWARRIGSIKQGNETSPSQSAVEADAVTLAQLEMLNRGWKTNGQVHVLVTSDRGLHRAFAMRKLELQAQHPDEEIFYPIRDPRQYVPLLNVQAMGGVLSDPEIFKKVAESTRLFVSSFASTDRRIDVDFDRDPSSMPGAGAIRRVIQTRAEQFSGDLVDYEEVVRAQLEEIGQHWLEAVESALVAKTDIISELEHQEMALWKTALMRDALRTDLRAQVSELGVSFEDLASTNTLLRHEIWTLEQGLPQYEEQGFRNNRKLVSEFDAFLHPVFKGRALNEILSTFRSRRGEMVEEMRAMARNKADRVERMLITGCLSLEIGAWAGAEALFSRARNVRKTSHSTALLRELTFFHCVARRLSASQDSFIREYKTARLELTVLARDTKNTFDTVRLRNEMLALDLSDIAFRRSSKRQIGPDLLGTLESWRGLERYQDRLLAPAEDEIWRTASKQYILNSCNLAYWHYAAGIRIPSRLRAITERALQVLETHANSYATDTVHGTIYPLLARYALGGEPERADLAPAIENAIFEALEYDRNAGIAFDLPYVDKAEFVTIRHVLLFGPGD